MAEEPREEQSPGVGEQAKALREDLSPAKLNEKLEEVIDERPKARHLLDYGIVFRALAAAVVVALILGLLISWPFAAIALVVVFFGGWLIGAQLSYDRRRPTRDASEDEDDEEYQGDRGEVEAGQEQEDSGGDDQGDDDGKGAEQKQEGAAT